MSLEVLIKKIRDFIRERDWEKHHNPRSLAISVAVEAAELLEHFQWRSEEESDTYIEEHQEEVAEEIADVAIYLIELCDYMGVDLYEIIEDKMEKNAQKYPAEKA